MHYKGGNNFNLFIGKTICSYFKYLMRTLVYLFPLFMLNDK